MSAAAGRSTLAGCQPPRAAGAGRGTNLGARLLFIGDIHLGKWPRYRAGSNKIYWRGIPGSYFTPSVGQDEFDRLVKEVLAVMREDRRMVLGVADQVFDGMQEAIDRLEAGQDPDEIESDMGELLSSEDPFQPGQAKGRGKKSAPLRDETLYDL